MVRVIFNGSYISTKNTGIGVVSSNLSQYLSGDTFIKLVPNDFASKGDISISRHFSPDNGMNGHLRRLVWLQTEVPKIVKAFDSEYFFSPLPEAPLFSSVKSIVLAHDLIPIRYPSFSFLTAYNLTYVPQVLHNSKLIFCNSLATAKEINHFFKVPLRKLFPIKLGFDSDKYYPLGIKREHFFLVLGRHNPHKNLSRVIHAFSHLKSKGYKIVFIGPFDPRYTPKLIKLTNELGIAHLCEWKDWASEQEKIILLNKCAALVIASLWEGFGLPALEAMACGTLVIASNRGGLPEVVADSGFLVNPFDPSSISAAMEEVVNYGQCLKTASKQAPIQASLFNWEETSKLIESIIAEIC